MMMMNECPTCGQEITKLQQRCGLCRFFETPMNLHSNGRCLWATTPDIPEWIEKASRSMRRSAGFKCKTFEPKYHEAVQTE